MSIIRNFRWLRYLRVRGEIYREFLSEFFSTFILMLIGLGGGTAYLNNPESKDTFAIGWVWGMAVALGVLVGNGISGAHMNPAVSLAMATLRKLEWKKLPAYMLAQYCGSFAASLIVYFNYFGALKDFTSFRLAYGPKATAGLWATYPKEYLTPAGALLDQVIATGILLFVVMAITDPRNSIPAHLHPMYIGFTVYTLVQGYGYNCGAPLNPARDLMPRIFTTLAGWGAKVSFEPQGYHYWYVGGIIGPHLGAVIGAWLYVLGIEAHWPPEFSRNQLSGSAGVLGSQEVEQPRVQASENINAAEKFNESGGRRLAGDVTAKNNVRHELLESSDDIQVHYTSASDYI